MYRAHHIDHLARFEWRAPCACRFCSASPYASMAAPLLAPPAAAERGDGRAEAPLHAELDTAAAQH